MKLMARFIHCRTLFDHIILYYTCHCISVVSLFVFGISLDGIALFELDQEHENRILLADSESILILVWVCVCSFPRFVPGNT